MKVQSLAASTLAESSTLQIRALASSDVESTVLITYCESLDLVLLNVLSPKEHAFGALTNYEAERQCRQFLFSYLKGENRTAMKKWMRSNRIVASSVAAKLLFGPLASAMQPGRTSSHPSADGDRIFNRLFGVWSSRACLDWLLARYQEMENAFGDCAFVRFPEGVSTSMAKVIRDENGVFLRIERIGNGLAYDSLVDGPVVVDLSAEDQLTTLRARHEWLREALSSERSFRCAVDQLPPQLLITGAIDHSNDVRRYPGDEGLAQGVRLLRLNFVEQLARPHFFKSVRPMAHPQYAETDGKFDPLVSEFRRAYASILARYPFIEATCPTDD